MADKGVGMTVGNIVGMELVEKGFVVLVLSGPIVVVGGFEADSGLLPLESAVDSLKAAID